MGKVLFRNGCIQRQMSKLNYIGCNEMVKSFRERTSIRETVRALTQKRNALYTRTHVCSIPFYHLANTPFDLPVYLLIWIEAHKST